MRSLLVVLSLVIGCHSSQGPVIAVQPGNANRFADGPPLATAGERMSYKLKLQGVDLATLDFAVGEVTELGGKQAIVVQGHAKSIGLAELVAHIDDHFTSWIDVTTGRSLRFQTDEYATDKKSNIEHSDIDLASHTPSSVTVMFHLNSEPAIAEPQTISMPDVWDYNAFLLAMRSWEGPIGTTVASEVFRSRFMWHVDIRIAGKDKLVTELGELPALRLDAHTYKLDRSGGKDKGSDERDFTVWISDDDGRVPLQISARTDYGDVKMQIVDYNPGTGKRLRP